MADKEHVKILRQGVEVWNRWRKENPDIRPDLSGVDLSGADLSEADLSRAILRGADLSEADLSRADLYEANLSGANLSRADLSGANLLLADLSGANLSGADLSGADLSGEYFPFSARSEAYPREAKRRQTERLLAALREAYLREAERRVAERRVAERSEKAVNFTVFYPLAIFPERWYKLLAYVHLPSAFEFVLADSRTQLGIQARDFATGRDHAAQLIKQGAEIMFVPELRGCRFNPPRTSLLWLEDWHRAEFRIQAEPDLPGFELDMPVTGRVAFYVGPILIGEAQITVLIFRDAMYTQPEQPDAHVIAKPYQSVFVSYSHKDTAIVDRLERVYTVLGMEYLRDVRILRSGEKWNPALLGKIEEANIFQLCWSSAAKGSDYVEQEWRHAVSLDRPYFIRPVYWEKPMPAPPTELSNIHFAYLELEYEDRRHK
jgi:hypothetical protein